MNLSRRPPVAGAGTSTLPGRDVDRESKKAPVPGVATPGDPEVATRGAESRSRGRGRGWALEIVETLVLTLVIVFVVQNFVGQPFQVKGGSMERTFADGNYVLVDRLTPLWSPYARGQVVVFQPPQGVGRTEPFIKRVIAVGGDTVEVRDGQVFVNGIALDEPYLFHNAAGIAEPTIASDKSPWVVPQGKLFVMGDHRQASEDSRDFGAIPISSVIGRGVVRYWPPSKLGIIATPSYDNLPAP